MKGYMSLISGKTKLKCLGVILLAIIGSVLASIWPVMLGEIYTKISSGEINAFFSGAFVVAVFGLIYLLAECITIIRRVLLDCIIATHEAEVRENSVGKLLKMPVSYYSDCLSGEKTAQLNQGVSGLSQLIKITCNDIFATVLTAICTLAQVVMNASGIMAGIMLVYLFLIVIISVFQIRSQNGIREQIISQKNALDGQICQSISNLELIRSMNAEEYEKVRLKPSIYKICITEKKHHRYMGTFDCIKQSCKIIFQVILLLMSIFMITEGKVTSGAVVTVCLLFQQLVKPIDEVYRFMDEIASSIVKAKVLVEVAFSGLDPIFEIESECHIPQDLDVVFNDVVITNPEKNKPLAFYNNICIPGGKVVALEGPSGCGKTTMIRSLNRYYPYVSGSITLFGHNLNLYSQQELASLLFYVPQQTFFFSGSIRENLVYGLHRTVTDGDLIVALKKSCLLDSLIDKVYEKSVRNKHMKDVLEYCIGEDGVGLSGGERQRLSIARAFLRKVKLYVFDESTANLDELTKEKILSNIKQHAKENDAGVIHISHDNSVTGKCDEEIIVENRVGSIVNKNVA